MICVSISHIERIKGTMVELRILRSFRFGPWGPGRGARRECRGGQGAFGRERGRGARAGDGGRSDGGEEGEVDGISDRYYFNGEE